MSYKTITAKYKSECYECGEPIEPGSIIVWDPESSSSWHESCDRTGAPKSIKESVRQARGGDAPIHRTGF